MATTDEKSQFFDAIYDLGNKRKKILNLNRLIKLYLKKRFRLFYQSRLD